jgi:hypothetical protein
MAFITSVTDAVDGLVRRLFGKRLCAYCNQWAKQPYRTGGLDFCDRIHASVHFKKQEEAMKQALLKRQESMKPPSRSDAAKPVPPKPRKDFR